MIQLNIVLAIFDPITIIAINVVGTLIMGSSLLVISRGYLSKIYGLKHWGVATLIQTVGWITVGILRGTIPDLISIVIGNGLVLLSIGEYLNITRKFTNKPDWSKFVYALIILESLSLGYFTIVQPNIAVRIILMSVFSAAFMFANACVLACRVEKKAVTHSVAAIMFFLTGLILTFRVVYTIFFNPDPHQHPFGDTVLNQIAYFNFYVISVMLTFCFTLMCNERYMEEQLKTEAELVTAKKRAEELAMAKDRFLSNMSHEIRTPLNGIVGFTKILLNDKLSNEQKHQVELIKTSSDILLVLINDLLDITKINAGKLVIEKNKLNLTELTDCIVDIFKTKANEKGVTIKTIIDTDIPTYGIGDSTRISQILLNLISNSLKFTNKNGEIIIKLSLVDWQADSFVIAMSVSDTGIGISEQKLQTIFEPFVQDDTIYKNEGLGLGLSIVKQLALLMNGYVTITSELNKGTTVNVMITLDKAVEKTESAFIDVTEITENKEKIVANISVLLAEDNPINQLLIQTILKEQNVKCDTVENGKMAIEKLRTNTYDIILMDLKMPEMDGLETTEYIRTRIEGVQSKLPILLITADATSGSMDIYRKYGINDFITKPFNQADLFNKINYWTTKV